MSTPPVPDQAADQTPRSEAFRRKKILRAAAGLLVAMGLAVGIPLYLHAMSHESTDDAFVEGHVVAVSPRVAGHIAKVLVRDNQWVHTGDVLVELDPSDYQARLDAAQAAVSAARSKLEAMSIDVDLTSISSNSGLEGAEAGVAQAAAELASAKAALAQAKADVSAAQAKHNRDAADLVRAQDMSRTGAVSPQQLDHAVAAEGISAADLIAADRKVQTREAARQVAEQSLLQAQARLSQAKSAPKQVAQSRSQAQAAEDEMKQAAAALEQARLNRSYATIAAPCDGYVTRKNAEAGAYVQTGQTLLSIVQPDLWVVANFKETQLTDMRAGQPAKIEIDTYPGVVFHGHVDSIQRGTGPRFSLLPPENASGNFVKVVQRVPVKIVFDDKTERDRYLLAPGMSAQPEVDISAKAPAAGDQPRTGEPRDPRVRSDQAGGNG